MQSKLMPLLLTLFMKTTLKLYQIIYWSKTTLAKVVKVLGFYSCQHLAKIPIEHLLLITFVRVQIIFVFHIDNRMVIVTI